MKQSLLQKSGPFLEYIENWLDNVPEMSLGEAIPAPQKAAILCVDVTNGFCKRGALASARVARIVQPIVQLFQAAWQHGVKDILLINDHHDPQSPEFSAYPPHAVRGTDETEAVDEIKNLPFYQQLALIPKNSVAPGVNTGLFDWMAAHREMETIIVVGDVTDICTYQLAIYAKTDANSRNMLRRVIVPVDCVDTYDRPVEIAQQQGGFPHDADLLHSIFLYHMALNGIEIVQHVH